MTSAKHRECGRPRYQKGCQCGECVSAGDTAPHRKCPTCVKANRDYSKRHARLTSIAGGKVEDLPPGPRPERNPARLVETAVEEQIELLGDLAVKEPALAAAMLAAGRLLDDPTAGPQHPAAIGQLRMTLKDIRTGGTGKATSKLKAMRGGRGA